ncbi:outer membrane beta-barrel protein [Xanthomarina sp. F2636L]|uniref:outer membrane beta-barrel protein n=1 Tax=Xanthomarina sp. F2636L TaxID=2996018 RepID=UPI00225E51BF|nr:outer membrane beta-barrel protein [Xanthomarina sp. F2636L]MCX7550663.1 porin family protein [Xanthomarina sp. F2636L]
MKKLNIQPFKSNKLFLIFAALFFIGTQIQAQIALGGGLAYNEKVSGPGITLKAEFNITENIAIAPGGTYFFGNSLYGYNQNIIAVDVNAHYFFNIIEEKLKIYPLLGINYSNYKTGSTYYGYYYNTYEVKDSAFGANIGAGGRWAFSEKLSVYLEPKYIISDYEQIVINAGILFQI